MEYGLKVIWFSWRNIQSNMEEVVWLNEKPRIQTMVV